MTPCCGKAGDSGRTGQTAKRKGCLLYTSIVVIKKDKSRETFDRNKLLSGLLRACEKRPVSIDTRVRIVDEIETLLQNSLDREVSSQRIGTYGMEKLKTVDEVAYVRFASVYRQFKDINSFMEELSKIINSKKD